MPGLEQFSKKQEALMEQLITLIGGEFDRSNWKSGTTTVMFRGSMILSLRLKRDPIPFTKNRPLPTFLFLHRGRTITFVNPQSYRNRKTSYKLEDLHQYNLVKQFNEIKELILIEKRRLAIQPANRVVAFGR